MNLLFALSRFSYITVYLWQANEAFAVPISSSFMDVVRNLCCALVATGGPSDSAISTADSIELCNDRTQINNVVVVYCSHHLLSVRRRDA